MGVATVNYLYMSATKETTSESSTVSWGYGRTENGDPVERGIGDTAHSGEDATYDRDAYDYDKCDPSKYQQPKEYDGDGGMGSNFTEEDVQEHVSDPKKRRQFERMWYWNQGANPSYEHPDGASGGDSVVQPSDNAGRRALRDKLKAVEWVCDEIVYDELDVNMDVPSAVRSDARTLASGVDGTGHCLQKIAIGAVLVADDRFLARKLVRAEVDGPLQNAIERLECGVGDDEIDTALNLLESEASLSDLFRRRLKRNESVAVIADRNNFKLNDAKAIFYGGNDG